MSKLTQEEVIRRFKEKHGDKYDYSLSEYKGMHAKIKIICKDHDVFEQTPNNHIRYGCFKCGGTSPMTKDEFIKRSIETHGDKYNYDKVVYVKSRLNVIINCPDHGDFKQTPANHIRNAGCQKCAEINRVGNKIKSHNKIRNWDFNQPEDYKLIPLFGGDFVKVDNEDFEIFKNVNWCLHKSGYAYNDYFKLMHRYIMNTPDGMDTDHINHNKLDNRKSNLRICNRTQNNANQKVRKGYTSKYKGVSWNKNLQKWVSQISVNNNTYNLGIFESELEAAKSYDEGAKELFGEYANVNFKTL